MAPDEVEQALAGSRVSDVHDLHVWTLTSGMNVATAHLMTDQDADPHTVLDNARGHAHSSGSSTPPCRSNPTPLTGLQEVTW